MVDLYRRRRKGCQSTNLEELKNPCFFQSFIPGRSYRFFFWPFLAFFGMPYFGSKRRRKNALHLLGKSTKEQAFFF
jgi:hypothetical protein